MKPKALVVEDDDRIIDSIEDVLFSIGHDHDWATNQHDAQQMLKAGDYSYVLLDLQIPAKPNRGGADKEFGANLLENIQQIKGRSRLPVIVMTAYSADCLDLTTELFAGGASEFIAKPFSNKGRTLASVIRKVLRDHSRKVAATSSQSPPAEERPFAGGEMVFHAERVELCDVTVLTNARSGQMRLILDELKRRNGAGNYVAYSGPELVARTKCRSGQNGVAGCIRDFRKVVSETLRAQLGLICGSQDVIRSGGPGYRLHEWITVRDAAGDDTGSFGGDDVPANGNHDPVNVPAIAEHDPANDPANGHDDPANPRRQWILAELGRGRQLRAPAIASELGCSAKTVKRELDGLRAEGRIEFVGPSKTGYYRLKE
jgi:CheY-like chemotaxis protein/biotin operon repressor